ncbi:hypothetical protein V6N13_042044 [Hibiscus sabdariffa]
MTCGSNVKLNQSQGNSPLASQYNQALPAIDQSLNFECNQYKVPAKREVPFDWCIKGITPYKNSICLRGYAMGYPLKGCLSGNFLLLLCL